MPEIDAFFIEPGGSAANLTSAEGVAEPPIIPVAPAIANAVVDALGIDVNELPITPWRVIKEAGSQAS